MITDLIPAALLIYVVAGLIKGTLGIGLPTAAVSMMAQLTDARTAIALVVLPMMLTNLLQVIRSGGIVTVWRTYWRLAISMMMLIGLVSLLAVRIPVFWITLALGVVVVLFAATSLWRQIPALPARLDPAAQWLTGSVAGVMGGIAGVWAPPIVIYMSARRLNKEAFVQAVGLLLLLGSSVLFIGYSSTGLINRDLALWSLALVVPALIGFAAGERIRRRLSGERFQTLVLVFFLLMGLNLIRRALIGGA